MYWGAGPGLGLLTLIGYIAFAIGAAMVWRKRDDYFVRVHDEFGVFRRNLSRYTVIGPFYSLRQESRLTAIRTQFIGNIGRLARRKINPAFVLLFLGVVLFLLDFLI
jgi:hypothetical protein